MNGDGRPDIAIANFTSQFPIQSPTVLFGASNGSFPGQVYTVVPLLDTITGTSGPDQITISKDPDQQHIDWTLGNTTAQVSITDPNGLTIDGNGGSDVINLDYTSGNPLPNTLHLNGTFTINGLSSTNPLANTAMEIGRSTIYIAYPSSDPLGAIQGYLKNGYDNGAWNGAPTASTGVITTTPAAQNTNQTTAIGYADSADALIPGQPANTIELRYTLYGDTGLTTSVGFGEFTRLTQHYNQTTGGTWDTGDFNYDASVNFTDFTLMTRTYNTMLGSQAAPATVAASPDTTATTLPLQKAKPAKTFNLVHKTHRKHLRKHP